MTPQEIRIAVAEERGWRWDKTGVYDPIKQCTLNPIKKLTPEELLVNVLCGLLRDDLPKGAHALLVEKVTTHICALEAENASLKQEHVIDTSEIDRLSRSATTANPCVPMWTKMSETQNSKQHSSNSMKLCLRAEKSPS